MNPRLNAVMLKSLSAPAPTLDSYKIKISQYIKDEQYADAVLALNEFILMYPSEIQQYQDFLKQSLPLILKDPHAAAIMQAIRTEPKSEEDLNNSADLMNAMREHAKDYDYLIDFFMANHTRTIYGRMNPLSKEQFDKLNSTRDVFIATLEANPWFAGAYFDFGNAYFADYEIPNAWSCWEHTAKIVPDFPNLKIVQSMESHAQNDFPEYF